MEWREISSNWVLIPPQPTAMIHFLGGAFVAAAPQVTYRRLLEVLAQKGYLVVATPFVNTFDHATIAQDVFYRFERVSDYLYETALRRRSVPIYGLGHSMGCKLHLLLNSLFDVDRAGNILMSFNNFSARRSIPFVDPLISSLEVEFTPSPIETERLIAEQYSVRRNLLIRFTQDEIDQTKQLQTLLHPRFPDLTTIRTLTGTHLTPLGPDLKWQTSSSFSALDAIGQWFRQSLYQELIQLETTLLTWLNPLDTLQSKSNR
jgi:Protein of unknown function (DUF1350)